MTAYPSLLGSNKRAQRGSGQDWHDRCCIPPSHRRRRTTHDCQNCQERQRCKPEISQACPLQGGPAMSHAPGKEDDLDEALDESFPASDPPSMTASTIASSKPSAGDTAHHLQVVLDACDDCAVACMHCLAEMASIASSNQCPTCCVECAAVCRITADAIARNSPNADQFRLLCAQVCNWCASECEVHSRDHCLACAEACRKCAAACA